MRCFLNDSSKPATFFTALMVSAKFFGTMQSSTQWMLEFGIRLARRTSLASSLILLLTKLAVCSSTSFSRHFRFPKVMISLSFLASLATSSSFTELTTCMKKLVFSSSVIGINSRPPRTASFRFKFDFVFFVHLFWWSFSSFAT